jgi:adenylate cyclase class 2
VETEYEARVLEVDPVETGRLILSRGGRCLGDKFMRRFVYDIESGDATRWIRLRDTGTEVTLTVKEITSDAIDRWPHIPPYLEIEADSEPDVLRTARLLGYAPDDLTGENTMKIYRRYGYELDDIPELRFESAP